MNASEALSLTRKSALEVDSLIWADIIGTIRRAALLGRYETAIDVRRMGSLGHEAYVAKLKAEGYYAQRVSDQRDGDYVEIKW